jgi:hypothetical protein
MASWENMGINTDSNDLEIDDIISPDTSGLMINPESLHNEFHATVQHLSEVEQRHRQVLVTAGMIPEEHIANIEPTMKLQWMVEELNGRINPDGLVIPLLGININELQIFTKDETSNLNVKLSIIKGESETFERVFNIPKDTIKNAVSAHFLNNRLHLRW